MQNTTSQILYKYWNEVRGTRMAPRRFEIEPARFAAILPETFMIECEPGEGYRFRLAGTRVSEKLGLELRGHDLSEIFAASEHSELRALLGAVTNRGGAGVLTADMPGSSGRRALFEMIVLPLVHTANQVTRILGSMSTRDHESWLGNEPLFPGRIVSHAIIWPEGRPHAIAERMEPQSVFRPAMAGARLVRGKRRVFRVYDGGGGR